MPIPDDQLFAAAIEFEHLDQQESFVESQAVDAAQRARLSLLLEKHHQLQINPGMLLLNCTEELFSSYLDLDDFQPGSRIGNYELRELIGEGGMGVVFRAQQLEPLQRPVALKLLKPGMDSNRVLGRFALERQILQRIDHPGVTQIFDAGKQPNGRPFFAMELIEDGQNVVEFAQTESLSVDSRLQLFIKICDTIQHAHQKGVIHRDLKPSNLLVARKGEEMVVKVIDFGIAKAVDSTFDSQNVTTQIGEHVGTPAYMAPEHSNRSSAENGDVRSDVYSLGVVLAQLLTGQSPTSNRQSDGASLVESNRHAVTPAAHLKRMEEAAVEDQAARCGLSQIAFRKIVNNELNWICSKAVSFNPCDRYPTVSDLKRDLIRYLDALPVEAAKPSVLYSTKKFVRRNLILSSVMATSAATIAIVTMLAIWFAFRAISAEEVASNRLEKVLVIQEELVKQRDEANEARRKVMFHVRKTTVDKALMKAVSDYQQVLHEELLKAKPGDRNPFAQFDPKKCFDMEFLQKAHSELVIKGDWSWMDFRGLAQSRMDSARFGRELHAAYLPEERHRQPDLFEVNSVNAKGLENSDFHRMRFQQNMLTQLQKSLPADDPLIAEALDNCAMGFIEESQFELAEQYLRKSISVWGKDDLFLPQLTQAELFIAHCLRRQGNTGECRLLQETAVKRIDDSRISEQDRIKLRELRARLDSREKAENAIQVVSAER